LAASHQIKANGLLYTVVDDCTISYLAVVTGRVTDEIFGDFREPGLTVSVSSPDLTPKTSSDGLYAIAGYPAQALPDLGTTSYSLTLTVGAPGFRTVTLLMMIPMNAAFPVPAPPAALRRLPVRIQGRVVKDAIPHGPVGGVLIQSQPNPSTPTTFVTALRSQLYFSHASGAGVQAVSLTTAGSAVLGTAAAAGSKVLNLSTRSGLTPGVLVQLSTPAAELVENGLVDRLGPGAPASPGQVFLTNALNRTYANAGAVSFFSASPVGPTANLLTDADAGDGVLVATQIFTGTTLVVDAGALNVEYHEIGALTGSDGFYGFDGMGRVQDIVLKAGASPKAVDWFIEYAQPINVVDFRI
jgi:hypothetical protein